MEARVLGRVAAADDDTPGSAADEDLLTVGDASEAVRQGVDDLAEVAKSSLITLDRFAIPAGSMIEAQRVRGRFASHVRNESAARQVFESGDPELAVESAGQPAGHADVVGVHVGADDTFYRPIRHQTRHDVLPGGSDGVGPHAGVYQGPTVAVLERPQVDVV